MLANVLDNLPAYLVAEHFAGSTSRLVTVLVGVNVGPMLLVWGSLANLLWLRACRARGLRSRRCGSASRGCSSSHRRSPPACSPIWLT